MSSLTPRCPLMVILGVSILSLSACYKDDWGDPHAMGERLSAARPECPQMWDTIPLYGVLPSDITAERRARTVNVTLGMISTVSTVVGPGGLSLSGPRTNIPEFNDCQKLIVQGAEGPQYAGLVAIFAAFKLDSIGASIKWDSLTWASKSAAVATVSASGVVTGVTVDTTFVVATPTLNPARQAQVLVDVVPGPNGGPLPPVPVSPSSVASVTLHVGESVQLVADPNVATQQTLPAAEIYDYGDEYAPLGIKPNFNCLYLYYDGTGAIRAKMVPVSSLSNQWDACLTAVDPSNASIVGTPLDVIRTPGAAPDDVPSVARWDWDDEHQQQTIGIRCGSAWCEVGTPGFQRSQSYSVEPGTSSQVARVVTVKGWYDEQLLAVNSPTVAPARPSSVRGTIIPDPELGFRTKGSFRHTWIPVAYAALSVGANDARTVEYYYKKLHFEPVPVSGSLRSLNGLQACFGTRGECNVPIAALKLNVCGPESAYYGIVRYRRMWTKITSATSRTDAYRCNKRRYDPLMPPSMTIPATARWRWVLSDETVWNDCVEGCCESEGIQ